MEMMDTSITSEEIKAFTPIGQELQNGANSESGRLSTNTTSSTKSTGGKSKATAAAGKKKRGPKKKKSSKSTSQNTDEITETTEGEWAVEKIIDKKIENGEVKYYIKWQDWDSIHNTWEPVANLSNCPFLITEFEAKLVSNGNNSVKSAKKRGSSASSQSSANRAKRKIAKLNNIQPDDPDSDSGISNDGNEDIPLNYSVLSECPPGKLVEKIHAVTVLDGYLSFIVQWKDSGRSTSRGHSTINGKAKRPTLSERNANVVRATAMNIAFPQEVISFYQQRVHFNICITSKEKEAEKAARALVQAKEREAAEMVLSLNSHEDEEEDPATREIQRAERKRDKFNVHESDLSSTDSDDSLGGFSSDDE